MPLEAAFQPLYTLWMKALKNKNCWLIAAALGASLAYYLTYRAPLESNEVKVTRYYEDLRQIIGIHSSPAHKLRVGKHTYKNVIGFPPYYLELPEIQAILLVQSPNHYAQKIILHYYNGSSITFNDPYGSFPAHIIGDKRLSVPSCTETEIICKDTAYDITYTFNLTTGTFRRQPDY